MHESILPTLAMAKDDWLNLVYLLAAVLFYLGLKMLSSVKTARRGNLVSALGMLIATGATFFYITGGQTISLLWIAVGLAIGATIGLTLALRVPMTAMPEMVALLNGFGGIASLLVACGDYLNKNADPYIAISDQHWNTLLAIGLATLVGGLTFTGSLVAYAKLAGSKFIPDAPVQFVGQKALIALIVLIGLALSFVLIPEPTWGWLLIVIAALALVLGVLLVIGIGGADMPVVIALLNSYSGIAASMAGFVLNNSALIITGALVGASGIILTNIMCKAMNRSLMNVLFGGVGGAVAGGGKGGPQGEARAFNIEDAGIILDAARSVIIVPGYGMAVAQAQHAVKELAQQLEKRSIDVKYAIHPVAGRMPGHMNVLLAEADVPYEQLLDLEQVNPLFEQADVALVIGANDVTNPAARHDTTSPIYGMPILDVDKARTVFVIKRSMNPGFAGIQNELYFKENTGMIFGDAKKVVSALTAELAAN
jgi:NAD(P) transhydrogenase subunit beta